MRIHLGERMSAWRWAHAWLAAVLLTALGFRFAGEVPSGMFNDQAVELLQSEDLPTDHFVFFVPSYRGGHVDVVESLVPYAVRLVRDEKQPGLGRVHLLFGALYVA